MTSLDVVAGASWPLGAGCEIVVAFLDRFFALGSSRLSVCGGADDVDAI